MTLATRADVARFARALDGIESLAVADLRRVWRRFDLTDAVAARRALEEVLPALVDRYGEVSATVGGDWYDDLRARSSPPGRFTAVMADPPATGAVRANVRWSVTPLFSETRDSRQAFARAALVLSRHALQPARDTVTRSARRDPARPRWARVPGAADPCAFCLMLASRGPIYHTEDTAGGLNPDHYHADCRCSPTPLWAGDSLPSGYDPDELYAQYQEARQATEADYPTTRGVLSELRQLQGIR